MKKKPGKIISKILIYVALFAWQFSIHCAVCMGVYGEFEKKCRIHWWRCKSVALPKTFHYQNFITAFQDANMGTFFLNSVIVTAIALLLLLVLALPASYVLARFNFKGRKFFKRCIYGGTFL